jgi:hypothetical protein
MSRSGVDHPLTIDLVTHDAATVRLIVAEDRFLADDDALPLQEKLQNYLAFALGGLADRYPELSDLDVEIRAELHSGCSPLVAELLRRFKPVLAEQGVHMSACVANQELVKRG